MKSFLHKLQAAFVVFAVAALPHIAHAEDAAASSSNSLIGRQIRVEAACSYGVSEGAPLTLGVPPVQALDTLRSMAKTAGLQEIPELYTGNVPNAMAAIYQGKRIIIYNPDFVNMVNPDPATKWAVWSILAHEVGHHLNGHTLIGGGDGWIKELQADYYSGFVLAKLGATKEQALAAMRTMGTVYGTAAASESHPPVDERLKELSKGWDEGYATLVNTGKPKTNPTQTPIITEQKVKKGQFCCNTSSYKMCTVDSAPVGEKCQCSTGSKKEGKICQ